MSDVENQKLKDAILDFDEDDVIEQVRKMKESLKASEIMEVCKEAMEEIGRMFQKKEIFLTELMMSGELLNTVMEELGLGEGDMDLDSGQSKGKILLGTVKDDIHDIGKNIIKSLLIAGGYEVVDIGVDVPINKFVEEAKNNKPRIVALSGLLTIAYESMKKTIKAFESAGIRNDFKVIVGGGSTDQKVCDYVGADAFGSNAVDGVDKIKHLI